MGKHKSKIKNLMRLHLKNLNNLQQYRKRKKPLNLILLLQIIKLKKIFPNKMMKVLHLRPRHKIKIKIKVIQLHKIRWIYKG